SDVCSSDLDPHGGDLLGGVHRRRDHCRRGAHPRACPAVPLIVLLALIGVSGCGATDTPPGAQLIRDTLPGGVFLPRYASLPPPVAGPVAADLRIRMLEGEPHAVVGAVRASAVHAAGTTY